MEFKDKYISTVESKVKPDATKIVLTDDAYAISELLDSLIKKIEHARRSLIK